MIGATEDFAHSMVTLKEARNVRFADFVEPGRVLTVTAEIVSIEPRDVQLKTQGHDGRSRGRQRAARVGTLQPGRHAARFGADRRLSESNIFRTRLALVYPPPLEAAAALRADDGSVVGSRPSPAGARFDRCVYRAKQLL